MDLTINFESKSLNIRTTVILKTAKGYVFQKHPKGFLFGIGGRVKLGENSLDAVKREVEEEIGVKLNNPEFVAVIENFFETIRDDEKKLVHEICFVYAVELNFDLDLPPDFIAVKAEEMINFEIKPITIRELIEKKVTGPSIINRDF